MIEMMHAIKRQDTEEDDSGLAFPAGTPFKGVTKSANFINGPALASLIGLTGGTAINDNSGWLHFVEDTGLELYIAKKPLRKNITWEQINTAQVNNTKEVTINGEVYVVRFINGKSDAVKYAWNRYMYNVFDGNDRSAFPANTPVWGYYTAAMLGVANTNELSDGSHSVCAESQAAPAGYVCRGNAGSNNTKGILSAWYIVANTPQQWYGWRPVLIKKSTIPLTPFRGEVKEADFITYPALVTALGISGGTVINATNNPWLHFVTPEGKELYFPKKTIRHSLSWEYFDGKGLAKGSTTVTVGGRNFRVRFLKGAPADPGTSTLGGEWTQLIPPLVDGSWAEYTYTDLDVGTGTTNGQMTMFQEANTRGGHGAGPYPGTTGLWYQPANAANSGYGWRPVLELLPDYSLDQYLGEVAAADFIDGATLTSLVNYTNGVALTSNNVAGWLKFIIEGKTIWVAKRPLRYQVAWSDLQALGIVDGTKTVTFGGKTYKVRLLRGAEDDPTAWSTNLGQDNPSLLASSEWNRLMMRVSATSPNTSNNFAMFTDSELGVATGAGSRTLCKENMTYSASYCVGRGYPSVQWFNYQQKTDGAGSSFDTHGWRPVLELVS